ncbi:TonB-dependent receptor [Pseudopedobacter saltans DSM 12145]|uniref:TonB-dependent receptor n=1 Tax=Pseudopedobacter saltans (strain ATCC 51119 / DSM 12145 / JCM 21818 / CCUG 39354 / LMG 10337 / NBRC 100064 / NCIMB 13643) TaxID=762903 RepID=F0S8J6_PSESL|nr:TonB-dependent receptor [Pseudopedobacter saltans]ADY51280.1 TonB-dependent receptor [Pseudopedobacter saltans DSM 12145]
MRYKYIILIILLFISRYVKSQNLAVLEGIVSYNNSIIEKASISLINTSYYTVSESSGQFKISNIRPGKYFLRVQTDGLSDFLEEISLNAGTNYKEINLQNVINHLSEVIVTAEKRETNMQMTPSSISALDSKDVRNARIWDIKDLTAIVPNLYAANPGDLRNVVSIRGVTTTSYEPAVATYIDGVSQFSLDSYISQLNDIERIEVLRGPQSTLYGRNATGGVINIITKQPDNQTKGFAELNFGNFGLQRYAVGVRTPIVADKLYFGATGIFTRKDGFFFNEFTNSAYDDMKLSQGNYFLKYRTNKRLSFLINVKHQLQLNKGTFPLVMDKEEAFEKPFRLDQNRSSRMRDRTFNISLTAKYQHEHYVLNSQSSYQENYRFYEDPIDADFSSYDIIAIVNDFGKKWNRNKVLMHELRLSSPLYSTAKLKWNTGIYGFLLSSPLKQGTYYGSDAGMYGSPVTNFTDININSLNGYGFAGFGQIDYQLSSSLSLIAGLRYDYEHKQQQIGGMVIPEGGKQLVTRTDTSASANYGNYSPKIALNYSLSENHNFYGVYSRGFRAGGISEYSSDPSQAPLISYDSEYSNNFEIGTKNMLVGRKLKLNAALFYTQITNGQIPVLVMPEALTLIRNAAKMASKGFEFELSTIPVKGIELAYNFGYTDAHYEDLVSPDNDHGENKDLSGKKQVFTPETTSFLSLQYTYYNLSSNSKFFARLEYRHIGKQYFDLSNTIYQNDYGLLNSRLGFQYKRAEIALWGANIMDKKYISYAYDFGAIHLGNPKTYGLSLSIKI